MKSITLALLSLSFATTSHAYKGTIEKLSDGSYCVGASGTGSTYKVRKCGSEAICNADGTCTGFGIVSGRVVQKGLPQAPQRTKLYSK